MLLVCTLSPWHICTCLRGVGIKERRFFLGDMGVDSTDDRFGSPLSLVNVVPAVVGGRRIEADSESILLRLQRNKQKVEPLSIHTSTTLEQGVNWLSVLYREWNLTIPDTLGTEESVLISEVILILGVVYEQGVRDSITHAHCKWISCLLRVPSHFRTS